jgi:hypothetical protein
MEVFGDLDKVDDAECVEVDPTRRYIRVSFFLIYFLIGTSSILVDLM